MRQKTLGKLFPYLLILPSLIILAGVVFYPIAASLLRSFQLEEGGWGLDNYIYFFTDPIQRRNILYTLQIVIVTVVLAIGISYFLAIYLRFSNSWASRMIGRLYLLPRFIPGLVAVNGMITVIRDSGLINRISRLLGMNLQLGLMYNGKGIVLMNLWFNIPFATMLMAGVMNSSSGSMAIVCPILGERFLAMGVNAEALHRVIVVASSTLDSTPQSGFVCNILNHSHTTHRQGYWHVCVVSVIAPIVETLLLIPLCAMFGLA